MCHGEPGGESPAKGLWALPELCCSCLGHWALLCSLQGSGNLLRSWNVDLELLLQVLQDLSGFVSINVAQQFLGMQKDSEHAPTESLVTCFGLFSGRNTN